MMRWMARGLLGLLGLVVAAAVALWIYGQRTLPTTDGELALPGAMAELRIERDAHGIPTIIAASAADAFYGLGVAHAQDRLWQLETHRRIGAGRLSEAFGAGAARHRPLPSRAGRAARGGGAVGADPRRIARGADRLRGRHQRGAEGPAACTSAGVPDPGRQARELGPRRQPGLGHHDGLGPGRELEHRVVPAAPVGIDAGGAHRSVPAALSRRRAAAGARLRGAVPRTRARPAGGAAEPAAPAGHGAAVGRRRRRLEQLGGGRQPHDHRQAAARQRPAPQAQRAGAVVLRAPEGAGAGRRRRDDARAADRRAGPERARGLGLHQHRARRAGPLHRGHRRRRPGALPHARRQHGLRGVQRSHPRQGRARRHDEGAPHPPRPGDLRRRRRRRRDRQAARAGDALDRAGRRHRPDRRRPGLHAREQPARLLHRGRRLGRADAEHGGRRRRRRHRRDLAGPRAAARARQRSARPGARRRAGTRATTGSAGCRPARPRARSIRRAAGSPPPTSASWPPAIRTSSPANGPCPIASSASNSCWASATNIPSTTSRGCSPTRSRSPSRRCCPGC